MGQYYKAFNLDKREYVSPHAFDEGATLMEHSYVGTMLMDAAEHLLSPSGAWYKTRLVWGGDYMEKDLFLSDYEDLRLLVTSTSLYAYGSKYFKEMLPNEINIRFSPFRFLVNHSKNVYIDKSKIPVENFGERIHPLPLLASSGNGQGAGDYHGTHMESIGTWAGDVISAEEQAPEGFQEITISFKYE